MNLYAGATPTTRAPCAEGEGPHAKHIARHVQASPDVCIRTESFHSKVEGSRPLEKDRTHT